MVVINLEWKQLLWKCYHHGKTFKKDDSEVKELLGNYVFLERPQDIFIPGRQEVNSSKVFLENLTKGLYTIEDYPMKEEALFDYVNSWNDDKHIFCGDSDEIKALFGDDCLPFIYTYPERMCHQLTVTEDLEPIFLCQLDVILNRLEFNEGSNRAVATLYNPGLDMFRDDIPCLNWFQATIRDNKLELHVMFRSNDLYGAWPANMYFLTYIGLYLAENLEDIKFNGIHYHSSSLHIYKTDLDTVKDIIRP